MRVQICISKAEKNFNYNLIFIILLLHIYVIFNIIYDQLYLSQDENLIIYIFASSSVHKINYKKYNYCFFFFVSFFGISVSKSSNLYEMTKMLKIEC